MTAEGSLAASFIPIFTGYLRNRTREDAWDFAQKIFWDMAVVLGVLVVLGVVFSRQIIGVFTIFSGNPGHWDLAAALNRDDFSVDFFSGARGSGVGDSEQLSRVCDSGGDVDFFQFELYRVFVSVPLPAGAAFRFRQPADAGRWRWGSEF